MNSMKDASQKPEESFKPIGAVAFLVLLLLMEAAIWFTVYFIMLNRASYAG